MRGAHNAGAALTAVSADVWLFPSHYRSELVQRGVAERRTYSAWE